MTSSEPQSNLEYCRTIIYKFQMTKNLIKTEQEIQIMKEGGRILAKILKRLSDAVKPGITTNGLEELARELVSSYGVEPSFLGYGGYPAVLCTSVNDEIGYRRPSR